MARVRDEIVAKQPQGPAHRRLAGRRLQLAASRRRAVQYVIYGPDLDKLAEYSDQDRRAS